MSKLIILSIIHILTALKVNEALKIIKLPEKKEKLKQNKDHCTFFTLNKHLLHNKGSLEWALSQAERVTEKVFGDRMDGYI